MQQFLVFLLLLLLPAGSWAQQRLAKAPARPAATKTIETVQARYARLDQFARQLPDAQAATLGHLAAALATQARTEDDKARLIFAWVAQHVAYDIAYLNGDTTHSYGPEQVLQSRVAICQGYADLFTDLALRMGLAAYTVTGYAAVDATQPACLALGSDGAHAWNVYRAAGTIHIADACWGAGGVSSDYQRFTYQFNPFWFDTPPAQAIFMHLPSDDSWQLLPTPVALTAFRQWPYVESMWFQLGVSGASMAQALALPKGRPKPKRLPMVYPTSHQVQIVKVPRQATLVAGQPVTFVFAVAPGVEVGFVSDNEVVPLTANGNYRQLTIAPGRNFGIVTRLQTDSASYEHLLAYKVARPQLRAGQRRTAADSVTYLRR